MRKIIPIFILSLLLLSCHSDDKKKAEPEKDLTLIVFHPWANLTQFLNQDFAEMEEAVKANEGFPTKNIIRIFSPNNRQFHVLKVMTKKEKGESVVYNDTLRTYDFPDFDYTSRQGLTRLLSEIKSLTNTPKYGMIIGSHGNGWITSEKNNAPTRIFNAPSRTFNAPAKAFGIPTNPTYAINYTTLAEALEGSNMPLEFLLNDNCYAQNIENVYDLRKVVKTIIGSPNEIMGSGQPYVKTLPLLLAEDYQGVCDVNYSYYNADMDPYSTLSVVDCSQLDAMAEVMKEINSRFTFDKSLADDVQFMGGVSAKQFYDFKSYVEHLCTDAALLDVFNKQLAKVVTYERHTRKFYVAYPPEGFSYQVPIDEFCGMTCSDPSPVYGLQLKLKDTAWYKATHP